LEWLANPQDAGRFFNMHGDIRRGGVALFNKTGFAYLPANALFKN